MIRTLRDVPFLEEVQALCAERQRTSWQERIAALVGPLGLKVNAGNDLQADVMGGGVNIGESGTATATSATSLTNTGAAFPTTNGGYTGHVVVVASATTSAYAVITSNTSTILTVDKWYAPATPGGAAATTPGATDKYVILPGGQPAFWMAITTDATAPGASDTTLASELTASGITRAVATYAHTTGVNSYTLTKTFTNPDSTARVINKMGIFNSGPATGGRLVFESLVPNAPTLASSSDTVTITETITT